jgi:RNase P/RNase MRP subunit POP5
MKKRLNLTPSARDKRRYFIAEESSNKKVEEAILKYLGVLGLAKAAYMPVKVPNIKSKTVGSCLRKELDNVRAGLALAGIKVEKVSNTIKGLSG